MTKRKSAKKRAAPRRAPAPDPTRFIHVVAEDRQYSVHASEKKPLSAAIMEAFKFHKKTVPAKTVTRNEKGELINLADTPAAAGVEEGAVIYVRDHRADADIQDALAKAAKAARKSAAFRVRSPRSRRKVSAEE